MNQDLLVIELSRRNPYPRLIEMEELKHRKKMLKAAQRGYYQAIEMLKEIAEDKHIKNIEEDKVFLARAYGLKTRDINGYHIRINHEQYDGFFDWYHTTGTLLACHQGTQKNICKSKEVEDVAKAIQNHIYRAEGLTI